jgi:hypothetical protein
MMSAIIGIGACAALFVLFGILRPAEKGCSSNCGACSHACALSDAEKAHD